MWKNLNIYIFAYYFLYKFIQQNVYIKILQTVNNTILNDIWLRIIALITNLLNTILTEYFFAAKISKKVILSIYTSLLIILIVGTQHSAIFTVTFFLLNLTICESIIFRNFLNLWHIQLGVELAIMANYFTYKKIKSTIDNEIFVPMSVLWLFSIIIPNIKRKSSRLTTTVSTATSAASVNIKRHTTTTTTTTTERIRASSVVIVTVNTIATTQEEFRIKKSQTKQIIYIMSQVLLAISYIFIGCTTIRNTIYGIFNMNSFSLFEVISFMSILCLLVASSVLLLKLTRTTKLLMVLLLVLLNYITTLLFQHHQTTIHYDFFVDILLKKILSLCKCCISSFIVIDYNKITYKGLPLILIKFIIINSDTISFLVNTVIGNIININFFNIFIVISVIILYNLYRYF